MSTPNDQIIWHAHRGTPALNAENSIPGFLSAIGNRIEAIELDVVISKDHEVIVSHEPWMNPLICIIDESHSDSDYYKKNFCIYQMSLDEIQRYDCGSVPSAKFPDRKLYPVQKPTLTELIAACEKYIVENEIDPFIYNIEIKSEASPPGWYQPEAHTYSKLINDILRENKLEDRCIIQSFDTELLNAYHALRTKERIAILIEEESKPESNPIAIGLKKLNFKPDFYSPRHDLIESNLVALALENNFEIIAWTVNTKEEVKRLYNLGVRHIVTDYPILFKSEFASL